MQKWAKLSVVALVVITTLAGCRNSRRGVRVGGDAAELKVYVNFPPHSFDAASFTYELSACEGIPTLAGNLSEDKTYLTFKAVGLKTGMICQLRVKDLAADSEKISFTGEDKVLFWASHVALTQSSDGTLKADSVSLLPLYHLKPQAGVDTFSLTVPVAFDKAPADKKLYAVLNCDPLLLNPSSKWEVKGTEGWFTFDFSITKAAAHTCTKMTVRGETQTFNGEFKPAFAFTPEKDVNLKADQKVALKLAENGSGNGDGGGDDDGDGGDDGPGTGNSPDEVTVNTTAKDCTGDDEYYDIETRECKKVAAE